jgi:uncharacterized membrane protein SirB2
VGLSLGGFVLRGIWMLRNSALLKHDLTRRLPHVIDTILLGSALIMAYISAQYPFQQNWLTAKLVALIIYILLGVVALGRGKTLGIRATAWVMAVIVFIYIVLVALSKNPLPYLS